MRSRTQLYWAIAQRVVAIPYRRFGKTHRFDLCNSPEGRSSHIHLCFCNVTYFSGEISTVVSRTILSAIYCSHYYNGVAVTLNYCNSSSVTNTLTLYNPIFLPPAYSPALIIYFGWERGWCITCNSSDIMIFLFPTLFLMQYGL
jgi:hypothetical protein